MTANYKNNTNESRFIETAQLALSDQAVLDEFKNNYYASVANDPSALTRDGMKAFAHEWVKTVLDNFPNFANVRDEDVCFVEAWLIREILEPMAEEIKNATPEEPAPEEEIPVEETPAEEDIAPETPTKKPNVFVTFGNKTKKAFKRAIAAIRKVLTTIGNAIKNAAIKTGRKACDIAHFVYSQYFLCEAITLLESFVIGTTIGRIAVKIMLALHIVNYSLPFFLILAGSAVIAGLLAVFVSWLNEKILHAMSNRHLSHKYAEEHSEP